MPLLALLLIACQIICGLHVVRSGQERNWLYLISRPCAASSTSSTTSGMT